MARAIVLPLYPHTTDAEISDLMEEIRRIGYDDAILVNSYVPEAPIELDLAFAPDRSLVQDGPVVPPRMLEQDADDDRPAVTRLELAVEEELQRRAVPGVYSEAQALAARPGVDRARALQVVRDHAERLDGDRFRVERPDSFRDHAEEIGYARSVAVLELASSPIAGRPGWRRTADGREWYSAAWLDRPVPA